MLASSPAQSPRIHSSPSSIHYRRASNTSSSYGAHQNVPSSPRVASLRKSQNSPPSIARTRDASTQYSPPEQQTHSPIKDKKGLGKMLVDESAISGQQSTIGEPRRPAELVPESPSVKRRSGDLQKSDSSLQDIPPKRAKPDVSADKVLPARYERCDTKDLVVMLSHMIADLVRLNDRKQLLNGKLTRFHSRVAPGISAQDYLQRLATHLALEPVILLTMCFYMDRLSSFYSEFTVNSLTCHRFLITAATVATKGLSDSFWNNSTYARVGGVKLSELALLELEFLYRVDWRIIPDNATLISYYHGLITLTEGYSIATEPPRPYQQSEKQTGSGESNGTGSTGDFMSDDGRVEASNGAVAVTGIDVNPVTTEARQEGTVSTSATDGAETSRDSTTVVRQRPQQSSVSAAAAG